MSEAKDKKNVTVGAYLRGIVGFEVTDEALVSICLDRGFSEEDDYADAELRQRELAKADLYMWFASSPTKTTGEENADGGWRHKAKTHERSAFDSRQLRKMANDIYDKYNDSKKSATVRFFRL